MKATLITLLIITVSTLSTVVMSGDWNIFLPLEAFGILTLGPVLFLSSLHYIRGQ